MTTITANEKALLEAPKIAETPTSAAFVAVAKKFGVGPFSQFRDMIRLQRGRGKVSFPEYFSLGLFNPEMTLDEKRTFVGEKGSFQANCDMSPVRLTLNRAFVRDKVMYSSLLTSLGIPTTVTQAVASSNRKFGNIPALKSPTELFQFLTQKATFPLFGKPCEGSGSFGSVYLEGIEDDLIVLGNGRKVLLESFCNEVYADYPDGFILQSALRQHPDFCKIAGKAVGSLRFVTIRDQDKPRKLYALWKVPSPDAMSDNFWQQGSILVQIDDNGVLGEARTGIGLDAQTIERHPVSDEPFAGVRVPNWEELVDTCVSAHELFPEFGVFGWDVAVTETGPAIIECNANPFHTLYQLVYGRGLYNPDFAPAIENASKISADMLKQVEELEKSRRDARRS